jgi:hypothetical protein
MEYPLTVCESCAHNNVCKFIDEINKMKKKNNTPLNLGSATCNEYLPDTEYFDGTEDEEETVEQDSSDVSAISILENISESCENLPFNFEGSILFSQSTLNVIEKHVGVPMSDANLEMLGFSFGDVKLAIKLDNRLSLGEFAIIGLIDDNNNSGNMRTF